MMLDGGEEKDNNMKKLNGLGVFHCLRRDLIETSRVQQSAYSIQRGLYPSTQQLTDGGVSKQNSAFDSKFCELERPEKRTYRK